MKRILKVTGIVVGALIVVAFTAITVMCIAVGKDCVDRAGCYD